MYRNVMRLLKKYVKAHYPEEAGRILSETERYYRAFKAECPDLGGDDNMLAGNLDMGLVAFAAYEASGHRIDGEAMDELMAMRTRKLQAAGVFMNANKAWMPKLMDAMYRPYKKKLDAKLAGGEWGNTWRMEINPDKRTEGYAFHLIGCPLAEFAISHGYGHLMPHLCASDHGIAKAMHAKLIRTHTVAHGDAYCDYWYVGDKSEAASHYAEYEIL